MKGRVLPLLPGRKHLSASELLLTRPKAGEDVACRGVSTMATDLDATPDAVAFYGAAAPLSAEP
jgi:hypothetical protein